MQSVNEIWPACHIPKDIISSKISTKTAAGKLVSGPFVFAKN